MNSKNKCKTRVNKLVLVVYIIVVVGGGIRTKTWEKIVKKRCIYFEFKG